MTFGQVQTPRNHRGLRCETSSVLDPLDILGSAEDGCEGGMLLRVGNSELQGRDTGETATPPPPPPPPPTISNVVVYAVVRHWVAVMVEIEYKWSGRRQEGAIFYTDDGMVTSLDPR